MMTRDMELIRQILLQIEARKDLSLKPVEIDGADPVILGRHVEMLYQAGFIEGPKPISALSTGMPYIIVRDLSWSGHDFISALKNEGVWNKIKQSYSPEQLASFPLEVIKTIGVGLLTAWAKQQVGL